MNDVVFDSLPVVGYVSMRYAIEVRTPHVQGVEVQCACDVIENPLDDHHPLGTTEPAKGSVRYRVGLASMRDDLHMLQEVSIVQMGDCPVVHGTGQIGGVAAPRRQHDRQRLDASL